jgi:hypothetical protein
MIIFLKKFNICVKTIKLWYQLQSQNHNAMWHYNVIYNYVVINMNL